MVIVDTSVWIDLLKGRESTSTRKLEQLLLEDADIFITGVILQEILSGIKSKKEREKVKKEFDRFIAITPSLDTHAQAAEIFDGCKKKGYTIRSAIDCLIASLALEYDLAVLENDRDYIYIAKVFPLRITRDD